MKFQVVIARYNEKLDWLNELPINSQVTVYNKGTDFTVDSRISEVIRVDNFGRESETYLRHIVSNYNNLSDVIFFSQGRINDRIDQPFLDLKNSLDCCTTWSYVAPLRACFENYDWGQDLSNISNISPFTMSFGEFQYEILKIKYRKRSLFTPGAYFFVGKDLILRHPKSYYEKILKTEIGMHVNPRFGHYMERSWFRIFSNDVD